ncbi:hypothetical protein F4861DRAFT_485455 [Xylaria intraflava]|nr:hypothetical protein F4861DRAFT_485455 [Xylaria intraflava]
MADRPRRPFFTSNLTFRPVPRGTRTITRMQNQGGPSRSSSVRYFGLNHTEECPNKLCREDAANQAFRRRFQTVMVVTVSARPCPVNPRGCEITDQIRQERIFERMEFQDWKGTTDPKVEGSWNLHTELPRRRSEADAVVRPGLADGAGRAQLGWQGL